MLQGVTCLSKGLIVWLIDWLTDDLASVNGTDTLETMSDIFLWRSIGYHILINDVIR